LARYDRETEEIGIRARENAYHLRPRPGPMSNGMIVVKGDRAMVEHGPTSGFWYMAMRALARVFEKFYRHHEESAFDDDVGEPRQAPKPLKRTATDNPFRKPQRTPSMTDYRTPRSTPGMPSYRSPKSTPSTARLTSPHRTARAAAPAFGAMRNKKF
jgi:hypothetical protein